MAYFTDIQMRNGTVLESEKIERVAKAIIGELAKERLSVGEAKVIIDSVKDIIDEESVIIHSVGTL